MTVLGSFKQLHFPVRVFLTIAMIVIIAPILDSLGATMRFRQALAHLDGTQVEAKITSDGYGDFSDDRIIITFKGKIEPGVYVLCRLYTSFDSHHVYFATFWLTQGMIDGDNATVTYELPFRDTERALNKYTIGLERYAIAGNASKDYPDVILWSPLDNQTEK